MRTYIFGRIFGRDILQVRARMSGALLRLSSARTVGRLASDDFPILYKGFLCGCGLSLCRFLLSAGLHANIAAVSGSGRGIMCSRSGLGKNIAPKRLFWLK